MIVKRRVADRCRAVAGGSVAAFALAATALAGCGGAEPAVEAVVPTSAPSTTGAPDTTTTTLAPVELATDGLVVVTAPPVTISEPLGVVVVGDSLTAAAEAQIGVALTAIGTEVLAIDGVENRRMVGGDVEPGVDAIDDILAEGHDPDVWVVALGTNDIGARVAGDEAVSATATLLDHLPDDVPIVWVNAWIRDRAGDAALFNAEVRDVLEARGSATIVDWYDNGKDPGVITADGVHLTTLGEARFAAAIAAGVIDLVP